MEYRRLGHSGLQVSALSLGSWLTFGKQVTDETAQKLMVRAYELGVNFFDNAEIYSRGQSEVIMGKILKAQGWDRSSYLVSSKVFFGDGRKKPNQTGLSRKHLLEGCEASLGRLQLDYLDLYFCHRPDKNTPIAETVWGMNHLLQQGKILYWGTSEWSAQEIMEAHVVARENRLIGPIMEQPQYNMFHRHKVEVEFSRLYRSVGLGTTVWSPLASGVLTGKYLEDFPDDTRLGMEGLEWLKERALTEERLEKVRKLQQVALDMGTTLPKLAIAWCLKNPNVDTVILGGSKVSHLEENIQALDLLPQMDRDLMDHLDEVLGNQPEHPPF